MMLSSRGEPTVKEHRPTGGVVIHRETPELKHTDDQKLIILGHDVNDVLRKTAEFSDLEVITKDTANEIRSLSDKLE